MPGSAGRYTFEHFVLDVGDETLSAGSTSIPLTPKSLAGLRVLVEHAGQLVTKEEMMGTVWPEVTVGEQILKSNIHALRQTVMVPVPPGAAREP